MTIMSVIKVINTKKTSSESLLTRSITQGAGEGWSIRLLLLGLWYGTVTLDNYLGVPLKAKYSDMLLCNNSLGMYSREIKARVYIKTSRFMEPWLNNRNTTSVHQLVMY